MTNEPHQLIETGIILKFTVPVMWLTDHSNLLLEKLTHICVELHILFKIVFITAQIFIKNQDRILFKCIIYKSEKCTHRAFIHCFISCPGMSVWAQRLISVSFISSLWFRLLSQGNRIMIGLFFLLAFLNSSNNIIIFIQISFPH